MSTNKNDGIKKLKTEMVESLKLPKDFLLGSAIVTITGNTEIYIANYRGILEYTQGKIVLQTKTCQMVIIGKKLSIDYYTSEEMQITGMIEQLNYV